MEIHSQLSAHLEAATARLLDLIREFDARGGWNSGFRSCAAWLSWRIGLDLGAVRERVRVAHALGTLPGLARALASGELSYPKVRALTRVATPETEERLLAVGRAGTAEHVERIVRGWRHVDRNAETRETARQHKNRALHVYQKEDGMVVVRGRLTPEAGALLLRALAAAREKLYQPVLGEDVSTMTPRAGPAPPRTDGLPGLGGGAPGCGLGDRRPPFPGRWTVADLSVDAMARKAKPPTARPSKPCAIAGKKALIDDLLRQTQESRHDVDETTPDVFADFNGMPKGADDQNWSNRMILGDSAPGDAGSAGSDRSMHERSVARDYLMQSLEAALLVAGLEGGEATA